MAHNRVDELAARLWRENRLPDLEDELSSFDLPELEDDERESWHHLWGIAAFRRGDHAVALERFSKGHRAFPNSGMIAFSLGQEFEHFGEIAWMIELFDRFRFPEIPSGYALAQARYAYLWDLPEKALQYTLPILEAYHSLGVADDNFLYMRDLPFFGQTWSYLGAFLELTNGLPRLRGITEEAQRRLSDYDFERLLFFLGCVESGDFSGFVERRKRAAADARERGFPSGYLAMQATVMESREADSVDLAEEVLATVELGEGDFPWLEDIRLLARCTAAERANDLEREAALRERFLDCQWLLFEPDHAFNFRLLGYQEKLKRHYRERKRGHHAEG